MCPVQNYKNQVRVPRIFFVFNMSISPVYFSFKNSVRHGPATFFNHYRRTENLVKVLYL
jgi:hypothetical protein